MATAAAVMAVSAAILTVYVAARFYAGNEFVRLADVALPWRWQYYTVARGNASIAAAARCLKAGKPTEALNYARRGVERAPANLQGRLLLAELYGALGRFHDVRRLYVEGLAQHGAAPLLLRPALRFLLQRGEDALVVELANTHLGQVSAGGEAACLLALAAANACYLRGRYDQADAFLEREPRVAASVSARLLVAKMEFERGYRDLALLQLRQLAAEQPQDVEIHRELIDRLRRQGQRDEARRVTLMLRLAHPELAGPRIELLTAYREAGDLRSVAGEVEALLAEFAGDTAALLLLADFAANGGDYALVARIEEQAKARGLEAEAFSLHRVEAAIVAREFARALADIRELQGSSVAVTKRAVLSSLQAIVHCGMGDIAGARLFLAAFLGEPEPRAENLLAVANRLAALGSVDLARQSLLRAIELDPPNQAALMRLIEFDLMLERVEDLPAHVHRYLGLRRPSAELLRVVQHKLGSDLFLFSSEAAAALAAVSESLAAQATFARR